MKPFLFDQCCSCFVEVLTCECLPVVHIRAQWNISEGHGIPGAASHVLENLDFWLYDEKQGYWSNFRNASQKRGTIPVAV